MENRKTYEQVLSSLAALCSSAEHCSYEIEEKMNRWEIDDKTQRRVLDYLKKEKYIDDERYCRFFVREKILFNKWGRRKVEQALYAKRIDRVIQQSVLEEVPDEEYIEVLRPLIKAKAKTIKARNEYEKNQKLVRYALGRGFTYDIISQCIDDNIDEFDE